MERRSALDVALDMVQRPLLAKRAQERPLPDDVLHLIRIAAGSEEDLVWASRTRARPLDEVREAAIMFLQQVLFHPHADNLRIMGLAPTAGLEDLHEHRRWLLKWLHPDRNHDKWESRLFQGVLRASSELQKELSQKSDGLAGPLTRVSLSRRPSARIRRHHPRPKPVKNGGSRSAWVARQIRRACYVVAAFALVIIGWQVWNGQPIGQSLANLSVGHVSWLDW